MTVNFENDDEITEGRKPFTEDFFKLYREGINFFFIGDWKRAQKKLF